LRFKIDWASLIVGSKFNVFALLYFVFEGNFPSTSPRGAYICRGDLTEGFLCYRFGGLIFGGAYFRNFTLVSYVYFECNSCLYSGALPGPFVFIQYLAVIFTFQPFFMAMKLEKVYRLCMYEMTFVL